MNLQQLIAGVYTETARPDLIAETLQAVLSSTLKMHGMDYFYKDIKPALAVFDSAAYLQTLDTTTMPRFRSISYIRKWDPSYLQYELSPTALPPLPNSSLGFPVNPNLALAFFKWLEPDEILDDYRTEKIDVAYQVGSTIMMKSSTSFSQANLAWYAHPELDMANNNAGFKSWVADEYPYAIIFDAASSILQKIGMTDASRKYDSPGPAGGYDNNAGLVSSHVMNMLRSNITVQGR